MRKRSEAGQQFFFIMQNKEETVSVRRRLRRAESRYSRRYAAKGNNADCRGGIYICATYFWHAEGLSTRIEDLLDTMWNVNDSSNLQLDHRFRRQRGTSGNEEKQYGSESCGQ